MMTVRACPLTSIRPEGRRAMRKYVIERDMPGAGKLSTFELRSISQRSCAVLERLGPKIQWVQSYVTDDRIYCVYIAPDEEVVREHAKQGRFPANRISRVQTVIDPTTAE
jgi:uncharacterized protein DUF4242